MSDWIIFALIFIILVLNYKIKHLFNNPIFKVLFLSLLLIYNFKDSPYSALAIVAAFILMLNNSTKEKIYENCKYLKSYAQQKKPIKPKSKKMKYNTNNADST